MSSINPNTHCGFEIRRFGLFFMPINTNAFGAEKLTKTTPCTFFLIDFDDFSYHLQLVFPFFCAIISLHLSAYSHQSRQDCISLETFAPHFEHSASVSSVHISTSLLQTEQVMNSGFGLIKLDMPGQVLTFPPHYYNCYKLLW